jgi:hypothetical protein
VQGLLFGCQRTLQFPELLVDLGQQGAEIAIAPAGIVQIPQFAQVATDLAFHLLQSACGLVQGRLGKPDLFLQLCHNALGFPIPDLLAVALEGLAKGGNQRQCPLATRGSYRKINHLRFAKLRAFRSGNGYCLLHGTDIGFGGPMAG